MKLRNLFVIFVTLAAGPVFADAITVNLDFDTATLEPGEMFDFTGTLTNNTAEYALLNGISVDLAGLSIDTSPFLGGPLYVSPNATSVDFTLFTVTRDTTYTGPFGTLPGTVTILGLITPVIIVDSSQNPIGSTTFSVTAPAPTPEVPTLLMAAIGLALMLGRWRRLVSHAPFRSLPRRLTEIGKPLVRPVRLEEV
jgi:hypothetical protein